MQALTLILTRAMHGPTLILVPTSVYMNWLEESARFAPTVNARLFGAGDRTRMLDEVGPFDLIVCSYGLLQNESECLAKKEWTTIVADEAQAIKKAHTKRSKAVMALKGEFNMVTTGTPIENHLGEFHAFLASKADRILPLEVEQFFDDAKNRSEAMEEIGSTRLIRCRTPALAKMIATDPLTQKFCMMAGEWELLAPEKLEARFRRALFKQGFVLAKK